MRAKATSKTGLLYIMAAAVLAGVTKAADEPERKIDLKILYAGNPTSSRTTDFVTFLDAHFARVETADLAKLSEEQAGHFDVVMLDHDDRRPPRPKFSDGYAVPTVLMGVAGAHIASTNHLKTGYS